jgi:hypothetical protein
MLQCSWDRLRDAELIEVTSKICPVIDGTVRLITSVDGRPGPHDMVARGRRDFLTKVATSCPARIGIRSCCKGCVGPLDRREQPTQQCPIRSNVHNAMFVVRCFMLDQVTEMCR